MIYLTEPEIRNIAALPLTGTKEQIRDRFIIGCVSGLRFSDYSRVNGEHLKAGMIHILNRKTAITTFIPVHPLAKAVFDKYSNHLPTPHTLRYYNIILPQIGSEAGIRELVMTEVKIENKVIRRQAPKFTLITTHTARRSFATNAYKAGIPAKKIMLITGHVTEDNFFKYIKVGGQENAEELLSHEFFK